MLIIFFSESQFAKTTNITENTENTENTKILKSYKFANQLIQKNQLYKALALYSDIVQILPDNSDAWYNIGYIYRLLSKNNHAIKAYSKALALNPNHTYAHLGLAKAYLASGELKNGWKYFKHRFADTETFKQNKLDVQSLKGKTVSIIEEWGLGDTMQFIRYAKLLKDAGAKVIMAPYNALFDLFAECPHIDQVIPIDEQFFPAYDIQIPILSLPLIFDTTLENIPAPIPYLYANKSLIKYWKQKLKKDTNIRVGLCWKAKPIHLEEHQRTCRSIHLKHFAPLADIPGVSFYSLQQVHGMEQLHEIPHNFIVKSFPKDFDKTNGRFMDTAAVIKNLDLVISVDTSIVHLAGALGATTWVLLPQTAEWRWMCDREDSPWYPNIRLFRKSKNGDWDTVMQKVKQKLENFIKQKQKKRLINHEKEKQ